MTFMVKTTANKLAMLLAGTTNDRRDKTIDAETKEKTKVQL